jgi:hypothetical protein
MIALALATPGGSHLVPDFAAGSGALVAAALLCAVAAVVAAATDRAPTWAAIAALAALTALAVGVGWPAQRHYYAKRYAAAKFVTVGRPSVWARRVHGARIGYVGYLLHYPLYGQDLSNRVEYVGVHGPHGAFGSVPNCRAWVSELRRRRYHYIVAAPVGAVGLAAKGQEHAEPVEARWSRRIPGVVTVLHARVAKTWVFRLPRHLATPRACSRVRRRA